MTILQGDIRQYAAQVMLDTDDGGGAISSREITGGSNQIFDDSSQLDRAYGNIALRKLFLAIRTATADSYLGAHAIVRSIPTDPNVSVTLFSTADWFDRRTAARDKVERYLARGPLWAGHLLENQLEGQRSIQLSLGDSDPIPSASQGLVLVQGEGSATEIEQYVRVLRVSTTTRTFPRRDGGAVSRVVATLELSDPLRYDFEGLSVHEFMSGGRPRAVCRDTTVADATNYYGCAPLVQPVALGGSAVQLASIFTQLVPSSQAETPVADVDAAGQSVALVAGNDNSITVSANITASAAQNWYLGSSVMPGTLTVTMLGQTATDTDGVLKTPTGVEIGSIDYGSGVVRWRINGAGLATASFVPAAAPTRPNQTALTPVTAANRGYNWIETLLPIPTPGSLVVSYISQGRVYTLRDTGAGTLRGADSGFGSGTVSFLTGTVTLTTGALPDAGTAILYAWATPVSTYTRNDLHVEPAAVPITLRRGITPSSVTVTWQLGNYTKTASDNGRGQLTGDATGTVDYTAGKLTLRPLLLPMAGASFVTTYGYGDETANQTATVTSAAADADGAIVVTLPAGVAIKPSTVRLDVPLTYRVISYLSHQMEKTTTETLVDDGLGNLLRLSDGVAQGTINYNTRQMTLTPALQVTYMEPTFKTSWGYVHVEGEQPVTLTARVQQGQQVQVTLAWQDAGSDSQTSNTTSLGPLTLDLTPGFAETLVSGTRFVLGGRVYVEREGVLYHSIDPATGSGVAAGTLASGTGLVTLTDWVAGQANQLTLQSLVTQSNLPPVSAVSFRLSVVPARAGSVQVRVVTAEGQTLVLTPDGSGLINTPQAMGSVDYVTGIVQVRFGTETKLLSENRPQIESQPWYDPALEYQRDGSTYIRVPIWVQAGSARYNEVGITYLPLDASILGLDPVRLPSDGRVPMVRVGNLLVLHHTAGLVVSALPAVGDTLSAGRVRLSSVRLMDAAGVVIDPAKYTADLDAGTVTVTQSLALYSLPFTLEHRIEDMARVVDVQINGVVQISPPLTHSYPAGALASTALLIGDLQARVNTATIFSQEALTALWTDARQGNAIFAQYNHATNPITVSNAGCETERWAIRFVTSSSFVLIGEHVGQVASGTVNETFAPLNPASGAPYFTIAAAGWGSGWAAGNVLRFNTVSATYPLWLARTIQPGASSVLDDQIEIEIRGDVDRP